MMSLLKDVGLWDVLAGLSLSRSKAAGQPIPAAITSYASSVASSVPTGDAPTTFFYFFSPDGPIVQGLP